MLRTIDTGVISKAIEEMCIEANHFLSEDMKECLGCAAENEKSPLGRQILSQLQENLQIAGVVFNNVGSENHFRFLKSACNDAGVECFGYMAKNSELTIPGRHHWAYNIRKTGNEPHHRS